MKIIIIASCLSSRIKIHPFLYAIRYIISNFKKITANTYNDSIRPIFKTKA